MFAIINAQRANALGSDIDDGGYSGQTIIQDDGGNDYTPPPVELPQSVIMQPPAQQNLDGGGWVQNPPTMPPQSFPPAGPTDLGGGMISDGFGTLGNQGGIIAPPIGEPLLAGASDVGGGTIDTSASGGNGTTQPGLVYNPDGPDQVDPNVATPLIMGHAATQGTDFGTTTPTPALTALLPGQVQNGAGLEAAANQDFTGEATRIPAQFGGTPILVVPPDNTTSGVSTPMATLSEAAKDVAIAVGALNANTPLELAEAIAAVPSYSDAATTTQAYGTGDTTGAGQPSSQAVIVPNVLAPVAPVKTHTAAIVIALVVVAGILFFTIHKKG